MHQCSLDVRSYDCDLYHHVNHAVYLNYLEFARVQMLKAGGIDFFVLAEKGIQLVVTDIHISYRGSALADDRLEIRTVPVEHGAAYGVLDQTILRGEEVLTTARVKFVCTDAAGRPRRMEPELRKLFTPPVS